MEMSWIQVLVIAFGNLAWVLPMFLWLRSEANADRRDIVNLIIEMKNESSRFREDMAKETKEFHGRLCAIEERRSK